MLYFSKGILSMNKKVNKIIKQKLNYKKELQNRLPEETCNKIWKNIHQRLTSFYEEYNDLPKGVASHTDAFIFPAAAIYLSIKEYAPDQAFDVMEKMMKERTIKAGESFAKMSKIPGFKTLFLKIWDSMSINGFGEKSGFKNKIYPVQNGEHKMDITHCPYHHYLTKLGCPELTILFCKNDEYSYGNIPGIKFTRTKTIGGGAEFCDFKISKN